MDWLDIENWNRRAQFELFRGMDSPHYNMCANVEITAALAFCKKQQLSGFNFIVYLITRTANDIENFRLRIREGQVCRHSLVSPSFTVLNDQEVFAYCTLDYQADVIAFDAHADREITAAKQMGELDTAAQRDDLIYLSCIPWVQFTGVSHAMHLSPPDSIPRYYWGKYFKDGEKTMMPFSVQVNHALVDGLHVGRYYERFQEYLNHPESCIE